VAKADLIRVSPLEVPKIIATYNSGEEKEEKEKEPEADLLLAPSGGE
jgi:hypothetical protein